MTGRHPGRRLALGGLLLVGALTACSTGSGAAAPQTTGSPSSPTPAASTSSTPRPSSTVRTRTASWQLAHPLSRTVALPDGGRILVAGGESAGGTSSAAVSWLDPATGHVLAQGSLATAAHDAAGAVLAGRPLLIGGGGASGIDLVQRLAPGARADVVGRLPVALSDLVAVSAGDAVYALGGFDGTRPSGAVYRSSDGRTFSSVATLPVPVRYPAVAQVGGKIVVLGGDTASGAPTDAVQLVDPATGSAKVVGRLPRAVGHAAALVLHGRLLLAGGRDRGDHHLDQVLAIDPTSWRATVVAHLPFPESDAAPVVVAGTGYLLGGERPAKTARVVVVTG